MLVGVIHINVIILSFYRGGNMPTTVTAQPPRRLAVSIPLIPLMVSVKGTQGATRFIQKNGMANGLAIKDQQNKWRVHLDLLRL